MKKSFIFTFFTSILIISIFIVTISSSLCAESTNSDTQFAKKAHHGLPNHLFLILRSLKVFIK